MCYTEPSYFDEIEVFEIKFLVGSKNHYDYAQIMANDATFKIRTRQRPANKE